MIKTADGVTRHTEVPSEVKVNWVDLGARRGCTQFVLKVGVHITPETFLRYNDQGELYATVEHWLGQGPPTLDTPFAPYWYFEPGRYNWMGSPENPAERIPNDIHWPTLDEAAKGKKVRWPGSDVVPKRQ